MTLKEVGRDMASYIPSGVVGGEALALVVGGLSALIVGDASTIATGGTSNGFTFVATSYLVASKMSRPGRHNLKRARASNGKGRLEHEIFIGFLTNSKNGEVRLRGEFRPSGFNGLSTNFPCL